MVDVRSLRVGVIGLGYVGLPLACAFSAHCAVVGYDSNAKKIAQLKGGMDPTHEVGDEAVRSSGIVFTHDPSLLRKCSFIIVAVPTPVTGEFKPDFSMVLSASRVVGENLGRGAIVVFESTVHPGCTEEMCVPQIEQASGLRYMHDFKVGYSPERINPGDKEHTVESIVKVVSGCDEESAHIIAQVYGLVIRAGVHIAPNIRTAEAAKVIENIQRDLNIALMNEFSLIFGRMGISTKEVLAAAGTKWNFHRYTPGLVGGHCIGVDPYYLVYKAREIGYEPQVILAGREINEHMPHVVARNVLRLLREANKPLTGARVLLLGLTFKENVNDYRNSKIASAIEDLRREGVVLFGHDPLLEEMVIRDVFGVEPVGLTPGGYDGVILVNNNRAFADLSLARLRALCVESPFFVDVRMRFDGASARAHGFAYWSL